MNIECQHTPFIGPVNELLRALSRVGFFEHSLLIGSWPCLELNSAGKKEYDPGCNRIQTPACTLCADKLELL